ncbi:MAG TPA: cytochrome c1 [Devosiaceae bacterium]|jgi:ubiquinol-cytochrome c reductase cytochrome c1 subunit|nr:cytochrome c1 [Devosiaceae bacterium]
MSTKTSILAALTVVILALSPVTAAEDGHGYAEIEKQPWSFAGVFGTFDQNQLQRGFQVFRESCSGCHGLRLVSFRNLSQPGGPGFSEDQVKALAAEYDIIDPDVEGGVRPGVAADRWPSPFASEREAREAMGGSVPPDLSVMAKARGTTQPFPWWILNYFTAYQEGGPDYIHALLTGYHEEAPEGFELPAGRYYNDVFPGHAIAMPPPLFDEGVAYAADAEGGTVPLTIDQYSRDVAAFLMWTAEPHLVQRKEIGFRVMLFLFLFAGLMWFIKQKLWAPVHHHNPDPDDVAATQTRAEG